MRLWKTNILKHIIYFQIWEFVFFAVIMFIDSAFFAWLAYRYKSIPHNQDYEIHSKEEIKPIENKSSEKQVAHDDKQD